MTDATRQSLTMQLSVSLAIHIPGMAEMFQRLHPEQTDLARQLLDLAAQMRDWHEGQRELETDKDGRPYNGVVVR